MRYVLRTCDETVLESGKTVRAHPLDHSATMLAVPEVNLEVVEGIPGSGSIVLRNCRGCIIVTL